VLRLLAYAPKPPSTLSTVPVTTMRRGLTRNTMTGRGSLPRCRSADRAAGCADCACSEKGADVFAVQVVSIEPGCSSDGDDGGPRSREAPWCCSRR